MKWLLGLALVVACKSEPKAPPAQATGSTAAPAPAIDASMSVQLMNDARTAMAEQRWVDAVVSARSVQQLEPSNAEAEALARKAMKEGRSETAYKELLDAVKGLDRNAAAAANEKIPADSHYRPLADETMKMLGGR